MSASSLSSFIVNEPINPRPEQVFALSSAETTIAVHSHGFNLVLGRDLRENVHYACRLAIELAAQDQKVLYLNTYAGEHLLRDAFRAVPSSPECLSNILLTSQPTGEWNLTELRNNIVSSGVKTLVVNSFEFGAFTRARRESMAADLIKLQQEHRLTVIIFSHEVKSDLSPGCAARGAIGLLSPFALSVARISGRWSSFAVETLQAEAQTATGQAADPRNQPTIEAFHEKQTQSARTDREATTTRTKPSDILKAPIPGHRRPEPVAQLVPA